MKLIWTRLLAVMMAVLAALTLTVSEVEAKRLGGGKSFGKQSSNVTQRDAMPPAGTPQQAGAANRTGAQAAAPGSAAPAAAGSRWMAPLAGLAAGLGLAALASYLGFGEGLANFMMLALLVLAAIFLFRMLMGRRAASSGPRPAYQGGYSNANVGQEASVRYAPMPADSGTVAQRAPVTGGAAAASSAAAAEQWRVPADMDVEAFLRTAKVQFIRLQASFDSGNLDDLREFTSPEMFAELKLDIDERKGAANRTDVVTLDAQLLGVESTPVEHIASVRFTGMIREQANGEAAPFDEVWNLVKPVSGGGWVLGGIQQLN
ncbi:MAG: Tim44 domain-containing protein [Burkholderiaceae bacterium]